MSQTGKKNLVITSIALYFTYFIHGIGASIMGQYKPELAAHWGAKALSDGTMDVSMVVSVIAALGLGRLISLPFSGPLSDKFGRRLSGIIGVICYAAYFMGIAFAPSMGVAYAFAIVGGIANSFLDTCVSPACMEIYVNKSFCSEPVYKILHVYQPVSASFPHRICSSGEYVLQNHLYCCRCCDLYRWNPDPVPAISEQKYSRYSKERKSKIKDHSCSSCSNPHRIYKLFYIHAVAEL